MNIQLRRSGRPAALLLAAILLLTSVIPAFAVSDYDAALSDLTDPKSNQVSIDRRHPYSNNDRLNAMTAAYKRLLSDGLENLWEINPELMTTIASQKAIVKGRDPAELTDEELRSMITVLDLALTEPAAMHERSWYDYQLSEFSTGFDYARKNISAYLFTIRCSGKYVAMLQASCRNGGDFFTTYQPISSSYDAMYTIALQAMPESMSCPILLTDPSLHQAVAFLIPHKNTVIVSNYLSSTSQNDFVSLSMISFQKAAGLWNRDTVSMLLDAEGNVRPGSSLQYNNLESYARSQLRIENRERALRICCIFISFCAVAAMGWIIFCKARTRFLDQNDPNIRFGFWIGGIFKKLLRKTGILPQRG